MNIDLKDEDIKFYRHVGTGVTFLACGPLFFDDDIAEEFFVPGSVVEVAEQFNPGMQFWISFLRCDQPHRLYCSWNGTLQHLNVLKKQLLDDLGAEICISDEFLEVLETALGVGDQESGH